MVKIIIIESCRFCPCSKDSFGFIKDGKKYCRHPAFARYFGSEPKIKVEQSQLVIKDESKILDICPLENLVTV